MSVDRPHVAVIMSTYARDHASHLRDALASIHRQDYGEAFVHVYIARDGPVPRALDEVLDDERARGSTVLTLAENKGLTHALNACIAALGTERYVLRMDADDVAIEDRIRKQVGYMESHPEVGLLGAAIEEFDSSGSLGIRRYPATADVRKYICMASPLAHPTVCFRRSALDALVGYPDVPLNEDLELWFRAINAGLVIDNLPDVLLRFRISRGSVSRRARAKAIREFQCYVRGIWHIHGLTWRLGFPVARLLARLLPQRLIWTAYQDFPLRRALLNRRPAADAPDIDRGLQ